MAEAQHTQPNDLQSNLTWWSRWPENRSETKRRFAVAWNRSRPDKLIRQTRSHSSPDSAG